MMIKQILLELAVWGVLVHKLLALDQASRTTGWAYFEDSELKQHGKFQADQDDIGERLFYIKNQVKNLVDKYEVDEVVFEDIQFQKSVNGISVPENVKTFKMLAMVFGIVYELCVELKIPRTAVLAATWKSKLGIKGQHRNDQKKDAQRFVKETYNIKCSQDECDAICIGTYIVNNNIIIEDDHDWSE